MTQMAKDDVNEKCLNCGRLTAEITEDEILVLCLTTGQVILRIKFSVPKPLESGRCQHYDKRRGKR